MNHHLGETVFKPYPAGMDTDGETEMLGKKFIYKRSVMIALAVVALMTLTAGVAAAAASKAEFNAAGSVTGVGIVLGSVVASDFEVGDDLSIESVEISTFGEAVGGTIDSITRCKDAGKKNGTACSELSALLTPSTIFSVHNSTAELSVTRQEHPLSANAPIPVISGFLDGTLNANLTVLGDNGDVLMGSDVELDIDSIGISSYACLWGIDGAGDPIWATIAYCQAFPGSNELSLFIAGAYVADDGGPVMVPVVLRVRDTGDFEVVSPYTGTTISGDLTVTVRSTVLGGTSGKIKITDGEVEFGE